LPTVFCSVRKHGLNSPVKTHLCMLPGLHCDANRKLTDTFSYKYLRSLAIHWSTADSICYKSAAAALQWIDTKLGRTAWSGFACV